MTASRALFVAMPPAAVLAAMRRAVAHSGVADRLGDAMFAPENWHQSLSDRWFDSRSLRALLLRVGARVQAGAFTMVFNRIRGEGRSSDPSHWALLSRGRPAGFDALLGAIRLGLVAEGQDATGSHRPHVTISYRAPGPLPSIAIDPVAWTIDELLLVEGQGSPYRYDVIGRWPLLRSANPQLRLL